MDEERHYTDLLKAHVLFRRMEDRWIFYETYMKAKNPNAWLDSSVISIKEGLLLFGFIQSWDPNFPGDLKKFLAIYEKQLLPRIRPLQNENIVDIKLDEENKDSIAFMFDKIANCAQPKQGTIWFQSTDTSKILHTILPGLIVMWDREIRKEVLGLRGRGSGRDYDGHVYAHEFLPKMQEAAKEYLQSYMKEKGVDTGAAASEISTNAEGNTIAKLLDELNWIRYFKGVSLAEIRETPLRPG